MSRSGDAAEQVVKLSLEGAEAIVRVSGKAAVSVSRKLASALRSRRSRGKTKLSKLIRSGKELQIYQIPENHLKAFAREASRYGVSYCVLKDSNETPDLLVPVTDAAKVERIFEKIEKAPQQEKTQQKEKPSKGKQLTRELLGKSLNPTDALTEKSRLSERDLLMRANETDAFSEKRPSVRKKIREMIRLQPMQHESGRVPAIPVQKDRKGR